MMAVLGAIVVAAVLLFYKELKLLSFDRAFGASLGLPDARLEVLLTLLLVVVVVVGLQTVGVVLIVATLITPGRGRAPVDRPPGRHGPARRRHRRRGRGGGLARQRPGAPAAHRPGHRGGVERRADRLAPLRPPARPALGAAAGAAGGRAASGARTCSRTSSSRASARENWREFLSWPLLMGVRGQTGRELARSARPLVTAGLVEQPRRTPCASPPPASGRPRAWCASTASGRSTSPAGWSCRATTSTATPRPWSTPSPTTPRSGWKRQLGHPDARSPRPADPAEEGRHEPDPGHPARGRRFVGGELRPGRLLPRAAQDGAPGRRHQPRRAPGHRHRLPRHRQPRGPAHGARRRRPRRSSPCCWSSCSTAAGACARTPRSASSSRPSSRSA